MRDTLGRADSGYGLCMHSTNYTSTFIAVAEDTTARCGTQPKPGAVPTVAQLQHALLHD